jgi:hypothetical protein
MVKSYTNHDIPKKISGEEELRLLVEEYVSSWERVCRILATVEELIRQGLEKGISRQKLLKLVNDSDELKGGPRISPSQFARYCRERLSDSKSNKNGKGIRRSSDFAETINERIEQRGKI